MSGGFGVEPSGRSYFSHLTSKVWVRGSCSQVPSWEQPHPRGLYTGTHAGNLHQRRAQAQHLHTWAPCDRRRMRGTHTKGTRIFCALSGTHMPANSPGASHTQSGTNTRTGSRSPVSHRGFCFCRSRRTGPGREARTLQGLLHPTAPSRIRSEAEGGLGGGTHWGFRPSNSHHPEVGETPLAPAPSPLGTNFSLSASPSLRPPRLEPRAFPASFPGRGSGGCTPADESGGGQGLARALGPEEREVAGACREPERRELGERTRVGFAQVAGEALGQPSP